MINPQLESAQPLTPGELRLVLGCLVLRVEAPVIFEGVRIDRHNPHPARGVRITLTEALPGGISTIEVALPPPRWSGPVYVHLGEDIPSPPPYYPPSQSATVKAARRKKRRESEAEESNAGR